MKTHLTIVTNSETQAARNCMVLHGFAYADGLRPRVAARPLSFGSAFHKGPEALYRTIGTVPHDEVEGIALERGLAAIDLALKTWLAKAEAGNEPLQELYEYAAVAVADARWMFEHYVRTFRDDITRLVPLAVERAFDVPMRNVIGRIVAHLRYAGVWDLVAFDPEHGDIVIFDHKSTQGDISSIDRRVELDPQMAGYLYALREMLASDPESFIRAIGMMHPRAEEAITAIRGKTATLGRVTYNVVRKKRPTTPNVNKDGTVSVAAIDTLPGLYEAALVAQGNPDWLDKARANVGAKGGEQKLAEQIERWDELKTKQTRLLDQLRAKGDTFIGRREFWRTGAEIERWRREAFVQAGLIRDAESNPLLRFRNPGHCTMPWSRPCVYRGICLDDSPELRAQFDVLPRHVEVEEASKHDSDEED